MLNFRRKRGQGLVEFAMALPLLVTFLFGIIEFGFMFFQFQTLSNAMRAATRRGAVGETNTQVIAIVNSMCGKQVNIADAPNTLTVTVMNNAGATVTNTTRPSGGKFRLDATYQLQTLTFLKGMIGTITVRPYSEMIIE